MKVQIGGLFVFVESTEELDMLVARYGNVPAQSRGEAPKPTEKPIQTLIESLREKHGLVYVIGPLPEDAAAGAKLKWGSPARDVELLEPAKTGPDGKELVNHWFAKVIS